MTTRINTLEVDFDIYCDILIVGMIWYEFR